MKSRSQSLICAAVIAAACIAPVVRAAVEPGRPAPDFAFTDVAGKSGMISDFRGRIVVLEWINPGCPYVLRHYRSGNLPDLQAAAAADGVIWLQINSNAMGDLDAAKTVEWQKKQGVVATGYVRDPGGKLGRLYGAKTTPHLYVIAKDGTLAYQGAIDDRPNASLANTSSAHNYVRAALAALHGDRSVEMARTEPYGCGVKYGGEN